MQKHVFFEWLAEIAGEYCKHVGVPMKYLYAPEWLITLFHYDERFSGANVFCVSPEAALYHISVYSETVVLQFLRASRACYGLYAVGSLHPLSGPHRAVQYGIKPSELCAPLVFHTPMLNVRPCTYVRGDPIHRVSALCSNDEL